MDDAAFTELQRAIDSGGPDAAFDLLARTFREAKQYPQLFEARLMRKRHELGLPLLQSGTLPDLPPERQREYDAAFMDAAREVGGLFLEDGNLARAWPYFRAIGDLAPIGAAIEKVEAGNVPEGAIEIAFQERVNPRKGFELILAEQGICRAITMFDQYPVRQGRIECLQLLVRTLYRDLTESLRRTITQAEGKEPEPALIPALIADREWLFGEYSYYVDTSHLISVLRFTLELEDRETIVLAIEMAEYGKHLSSNFQYRSEPPFEDTYVDYGVYLRAVLGEDVDTAIAHFRAKVERSDPAEVGTGPAQILVGLLARVGRYREAADAFLAYLSDADPSQLMCPPLYELCQEAGDFERLSELARARGDLLPFVSAAIQRAGVTV